MRLGIDTLVWRIVLNIISKKTCVCLENLGEFISKLLHIQNPFFQSFNTCIALLSFLLAFCRQMYNLLSWHFMLFLLNCTLCSGKSTLHTLQSLVSLVNISISFSKWTFLFQERSTAVDNNDADRYFYIVWVWSCWFNHNLLQNIQ